MDEHVDPPSSVHQLSLTALQSEAAKNEVWSLGTPPKACAIFRIGPDSLTIGKLAVCQSMRGQGLSRQIITLAEERAVAKGLTSLTLQTRVELTKNHRIFQAMGFVEVRQTSHAGYDAPTSITFQRRLPLHLSK